jgi:hypothetical protein
MPDGTLDVKEQLEKNARKIKTFFGIAPRRRSMCQGFSKR